jgi:hypothetical protein
MPIDQQKLGELKRLRGYFAAWGMTAKVAGVDEEIAKLYRAVKAPAPVDETAPAPEPEPEPEPEPVVETATKPKSQPARRR